MTNAHRFLFFIIRRENTVLKYNMFVLVSCSLVYKSFNSFSAGIVFIHQNLTSTDVKFWRIKTIPALKGLIAGNDSNHYAAVQSQKVVSAYFIGKQILPFGFAKQYRKMQTLWSVDIM